MSIWISHQDIGAPAECWPPDQTDGTVRGYAEGWSNHYPSDVEKPAVIGLASIAPWCVPGHYDDDEHGGPGPWLRLHVATQTEERLAIHTGASVVINPDAARALAKALSEWADLDHTTPGPDTADDETETR